MLGRQYESRTRYVDYELDRLVAFGSLNRFFVDKSSESHAMTIVGWPACLKADLGSNGVKIVLTVA